MSNGDVLGKTDTDVEVTMYDSTWNTIKIDSDSNNKTIAENTVENTTMNDLVILFKFNFLIFKKILNFILEHIF